MFQALGIGGLGLVDGLIPVEVALVALKEERVGGFAGVGDGGVGVQGIIGGIVGVGF